MENAKEQAFKEKRADRRVEYYERTAYKMLLNSKAEAQIDSIEIMTKNISRGGLCLLMPVPLQPGALIGIKIENADIISAACEVRWCRKIRDFFYEAGAGFREIEGKAVQYIDFYVRNYSGV